MVSPAFISFRSITKTFAGVVALSDVSLDIARGECHGLMGENGAGKSTLGKVLAGVHRADSGEVLLEGRAVALHSPADALRAGIGMVHQELAFCPDLSVAENLSMGVYPRKLGILVDRAAMRRRAVELLANIGVELNVGRPMRELTTAQEQLVQIAAAVGTGARVIVFDEPTSSLAEPDAQRLFALIDDLKRRGTTLIYVSHRMREIVRLCDRVSVLRDGKYVGTLSRAEITEDAVVRMMIGRTVAKHEPGHVGKAPGATALKVQGLASPGRFRDVNFEVRAGEIVGFAGLVGAGRSEIATALFGLDRAATGSVELAGRPMPLGRIARSKSAGIALLPEDRKRQGLVLGLSCLHNFSLASLPELSAGPVVLKGRERMLANAQFGALAVKTASVDAPVKTLSGGNQQKVALAKWLVRDTFTAGGKVGGKGGVKVLIVDEPTRGVDVGAKAAIHAILDRLAQEGLAILLISSELPELLALSTRVLVMREGRLVAEVPRVQATEETILRHMAGVSA